MTKWKPIADSGVLRRVLSAEHLEPRLMLRANSMLWGGDGNLTLSFAPDGADVAGHESSLFEALATVAPAVEWQSAILRGFQTWAAETNAAIGVVADNGVPFGAAGATRGDARFGDIRIGAVPLAEGVFAIAVPANDILSGTWVGDVIFNANAEFASLDELFAVALHEAGHVFGLEHSADPLSPMHVHGASPVSSLSAGDVTNIQALYGLPQPDLNERVRANDLPESPTQLKLNGIGDQDDGTAPSIVYGSISTTTDVDYFRLPVPEGHAGPIQVTLRSAGISLLAPHLTIYDFQGRTFGESGSTNFAGDVVTIAIDEAPVDGQLLIRVASMSSDVFGIGRYSLVAVFGGRNVVGAEIVERAANGTLRFLSQSELAKFIAGEHNADPALLRDDNHQDDEAAASARLATLPGFPLQTRYSAVGSIDDLSDVDNYRVMSPSEGDVMTIRVHSLDADPLHVALTVLDQSGDAMPIQALVNGRGEQVIQVYGVAPRSNLTIRVSAIERAASPTGNYAIAIGFGDERIVVQHIAAGTILPGTLAQRAQLYVALPQLFHLAIAVAEAPVATNTFVVITIRNSQGTVVHRVAARPGETRTAGSVLLKPGEYQVEAMVFSTDPLTTALQYSVLARVSSTPFAADPVDPTFEPDFQCDHPGHEGLYCYPGGFVSANPYLWNDFVASLPDPPEGLTFQDFVQAVLRDWWTWVWQEMGVNGPPLAQKDVVAQPTSGVMANLASIVLSPNVLDNDIEPEHEALIAILRSGTSRGTLNLLPDGSFTYEPEAGFSGVDSFVYIAHDGINASAEATVRISVGFRGDYDVDGVVNGADFIAWQRGLGTAPASPGAGADGDGDGLIGGGDRWAWSDNFGSAAVLPALHAALTANDAEDDLVDIASVQLPYDAGDAGWLPLVDEADKSRHQEPKFLRARPVLGIEPGSRPHFRPQDHTGLGTFQLVASLASGRSRSTRAWHSETPLLPSPSDAIDQALESLLDLNP